MLTEGVHSGSAGGVVPSSFRILRQLLGRIEDEQTGDLLARELHADIPDERLRQIAATAPELGDFADRFPFAGDTRPERPTHRAAAHRPHLGAVARGRRHRAARPPPAEAGNVLRPSTAVKLSIRVPPTADAEAAADAVERRLTADPPYGARVTVRRGTAEPGWHAPPDAPWLARAIDGASLAAFGQPAALAGRGRHDPVHGHAGRAGSPPPSSSSPACSGPGPNAHGPNEFLHLPTARRVTAAVAHVLDAHARRPR